MPTLRKKILNKQPRFTSQGTRKKKKQTKPKVSRRKEIRKIRTELNEVENTQ